MNDDGTPKDTAEPVVVAQPGKPVTSSLRAINRLLRSLGGWRSNFRGLAYSFAVGFLMFATLSFANLLPFLNFRIGHLLALLAVAPLYAAWTHVIITPPSTTAFYRRIPNLRKTYIATFVPTIFLWASVHLSATLITLLSSHFNLSLSDPSDPNRFRDTLPSGPESGKGLAVLAVGLVLQVLLVIPAETALTRVQASLLPADQDTIVPFDRSFGGRVEPEVVSGKGWATLGAAVATVTRGSWLRIYLLRVKLWAVNILLQVGMVAIVVVQMLIMKERCVSGDGKGGVKCY